MLTPQDRKLKYSDVTPERLYLDRRNFLLGLLATTAAAGCREKSGVLPSRPSPVGSKFNGVSKGPYGTSETQTPYNDVTHYDNFYEFGTDKSDPASHASSVRLEDIDALHACGFEDESILEAVAETRRSRVWPLLQPDRTLTIGSCTMKNR